MGNVNLLKKLYLFKDLSDSELNTIDKACQSKTVTAGDEVFSQGEVAKDLFLIESGSIKICQLAENDEMIEITRLGPGSHFGEMSFLDGETRSATAVAVENSEVIAVNYDKLSAIMLDYPTIAGYFYRQFALFLCGRIRSTTKDLSFSRSKVLSHL